MAAKKSVTKSRKVGAVTGTAAGNRGKGRPKGAVNKTTASVKAALVEAFDKLGGVPSLVAWGKAEPDKFYPLWARMLPLDVAHSGSVSLESLVAQSHE